MSSLEDEIRSVLSQCVEAVCDDGCGVLMSATGATYTAVVIERADQHHEATGHKTCTRTWGGAV